MVHKKRKKNVKMRGTTTHGWGAKKKHRGAGHRGGRGNAGSGKRADCKKTRYDKIPNYMGKYGFVSRSKPVKALNIETIERQIERFIREKIIVEQSGVFVCTFTSYDKLLGKGKPTRKYAITIDSASAGAVEKIAAAGGSVLVASGKKETAK